MVEEVVLNIQQIKLPIARLLMMISYRFPAAKQRRMDDLLDKGNVGNLAAKERQELIELVDEFEERFLQKMLAMDALREMAPPPTNLAARKADPNGR